MLALGALLLLSALGNAALAVLLAYHRRQLDHAAAAEERMHQKIRRLERARLCNLRSLPAVNAAPLPADPGHIVAPPPVALLPAWPRADWTCDRCGASGYGDVRDGFAADEVDHLLATGCGGALRAVERAGRTEKPRLAPMGAKLIAG